MASEILQVTIADGVATDDASNTNEIVTLDGTQTLTNKTFPAPVVEGFLELTEEASPTTPDAGKVRVFAKSDKKLYSKDSDGTEKQVGSGAGSGEINLVSSVASEWASDDVNTTVTNETTVSNMPLGAAGGDCFLVDTDGNGNAYYDFEVPAALQNHKLKIEFWMKPGGTFDDLALEMLSYSDSGRTSDLTQYALSTDDGGSTLLPNATQKVVATFDTDDRTYYRLRFGGFGVPCQVYIQGVIVGPGKVVNGVAKSAPQAYTPSNTQGFGTISNVDLYWQRDGEYLIVSGRFTSGSVATSEFQLGLPPGLTIGTQEGSSATLIRGKWWFNSALASVTKQGHIIATPGHTYVGFGQAEASKTVAPETRNDGAQIFGSSVRIYVEFRVPIAEWAGGPAYLGSNDETWFSHDGTNAVSGKNGAALLTTTPASIIEEFTVTSVVGTVQDGDAWQIQAQRAGSGPWIDLPTADIEKLRFDGTNWIGFGVYYDGTNYKLARGKYRQGTNIEWSTLPAGTRIRARRVSGGAAVGFGAATATSMGLVKSGSGNFPVTLTGPRSAPITVYYQKTDKSVTLTWTGSTNAVSSSAAPFVSPAGAVPDGLRPVSDLNVAVIVQNSGSVQSNPGRMIISAAGTITIYKDNTTASFANSGNCGFYAGTVTYVSST